MIFPEVKEKLTTRLKKNYLPTWLQGSGPKLSVPPADDMRSMCMKIYLEPYKNAILSGEFKEGFYVSRSVEDFTALYQCCFTQYCGKETDVVNDWKLNKISKVSKYIKIHIFACQRMYRRLKK